MPAPREYTDVEAQAFELMHAHLHEFPGAPAAAINALNTMRKWREQHRALEVLGELTWERLLAIVRSPSYLAWLRDYRSVMAVQTEWNALRSLARPETLPAPHAREMMLAATAGDVARAAEIARQHTAPAGGTRTEALVVVSELSKDLEKLRRQLPDDAKKAK